MVFSLSEEQLAKDEFLGTVACSPNTEEELETTSRPDDFSSFREDFVAEQLTYTHAKLFKKVVPCHCLGSVWSQRDKNKYTHLAPTVRGTITQFNAVTKCVISTILESRELKRHQRAKLSEKWICIAHECRILKNFSSSKAIILALQSYSIYRLKKTWECVSKRVTQSQKEIGLVQQDLPFMTPCWLVPIPRLPCTCCVSSLRMNRSLIFPSTEVRLTGLYLPAPSFRALLADGHHIGKSPVK
ncbi:ral guanine nucleotide dissociation stimulator-like 1 [Rhynochetos jubatus]